MIGTLKLNAQVDSSFILSLLMMVDRYSRIICVEKA